MTGRSAWRAWLIFIASEIHRSIMRTVSNPNRAPSVYSVHGIIKARCALISIISGHLSVGQVCTPTVRVSRLVAVQRFWNAKWSQHAWCRVLLYPHLGVEPDMKYPEMPKKAKVGKIGGDEKKGKKQKKNKKNKKTPFDQKLKSIYSKWHKTKRNAETKKQKWKHGGWFRRTKKKTTCSLKCEVLQLCGLK